MRRIRQQISMILSQRFWPKVGDIDDCWVLSAIMLIFAVLPWVDLPDAAAFRASARDPDDGEDDGGSQAEIMRGLRTTWPQVAPYVHRVDNGSWADLVRALEQGHPVSVAVHSRYLPDPMGFEGAHRLNLAMQPNGTVWIGNPLAKAYAGWTRLEGGIGDVREAVMRYGLLTSKQARGAWFVVGPTAEEGIRLHPAFDPAVAEGVAKATVELRAEAEELRTALTACATTSRNAVEAARASIATCTELVAKFGGETG